MFALNVDTNTNRILSATFPKYATDDMPVVKTLPDGNISDYLYVDGDYVYTPLPKSEQPEPETITLELTKDQYDKLMSLLT